MSVDFKLVIRVLNVTLMVLLGYFCTQIVLVKLEKSLEPNNSGAVNVVSTPTDTKKVIPLAHYNPILTRNIFNSKGSIGVLFDQEENGDISPFTNNSLKFESSAATSLGDLLLRGTLLAGTESLAVFEQRSVRKQIVVGIGQELSNGLILEEVFPDRVVIRRNGKREEMVIHHEKTPQQGAPKTNRANSGIRAGSENKFEISSDVMSKSLENVNDLIRQIAMRPKLQDGTCIGYEVRRIKKGSIFNDIGLQKGDILQRVNGMELSDPEDAFRVYKSLMGETSFNIDLLRDGQKTTLNYEIR